MYYTFHCELPHCTFHVSLSFSMMKAGTVHFSNSTLFCQRLIIGQLNVPAATAENEEQYIFSNITYIEFQNSYSFFEVFFDKQLFLKVKQIH